MMTDKCKWCGAHLWDYGDVGPLHGKDGRSVNACELIQLRKLLDEAVAGSFPSEPGTAVSINMRDWLNRAKAIRSVGRRNPSHWRLSTRDNIPNRRQHGNRR